MYASGDGIIQAGDRCRCNGGPAQAVGKFVFFAIEMGIAERQVVYVYIGLIEAVEQDYGVCAVGIQLFYQGNRVREVASQFHDDGDSENEHDGTRSITDLDGRTVTFNEDVNKVFVDWAQGLVILMTLDEIDKQAVVASYMDEGDTFAWASIICPDFLDVPRDSAPYSNVEALLNYEPDIVFTIEKSSISKYENVGIPAAYVEFTDYDKFQKSITLMAEVIGGDAPSVAKNYCDFMNGNIELVEERLADLPDDERPTVYYMDGRTDSCLITVGSGEIEETWIETAGGDFSTKEFSGRAIEMTKEKFLELDPDIILIGSQWQAAAKDLLLADETLSGLSAIQNNQVYRIPPGLFPWCKMGPEQSMQMVWAGKLLHPEYFEDIDIEDMARNFYKQFFDYDISDEYLDAILSGKLSPTGA